MSLITQTVSKKRVEHKAPAATDLSKIPVESFRKRIWSKIAELLPKPSTGKNSLIQKLSEK